VCLVAGRPISDLQRKSSPLYRILQLGVTRPRPELYARIDARVDRMIEAGLVDEVRRLAEAGYGWDLPAMTGLGYRQIGQYLRREITLDQVVALIKKGTRRLVQQQHNWFRPQDPAIWWVDPGRLETAEVLAVLKRELAPPRPLRAGGIVGQQLSSFA
jgi:tRNA dimethylallyltransferase